MAPLPAGPSCNLRTVDVLMGTGSSRSSALWGPALPAPDSGPPRLGLRAPLLRSRACVLRTFRP
eukprot:11092486-Heterocapsa_arctica.AAC.1